MFCIDKKDHKIIVSCIDNNRDRGKVFVPSRYNSAPTTILWKIIMRKYTNVKKKNPEEELF